MEMMLETEDRDAAKTTSALLRSANALVKDPAEAQALVAQTLAAARRDDPASPRPSYAQLFRMLRQTYHSIERSRRGRPMRDALLTSMAKAGAADGAEPPG